MHIDEANLIVSAVAACAGLGAVWGTLHVAGKQQEEERARRDQERVLAEKSDVREVLATATRALWEMKQKMKDELTAFSPGLTSGKWPDDFTERIGALEKSRDVVEAESDILSIRFDETRDVVVSYRAAWKAVIWLISVYMTNVGGPGDREALAEALKVSVDFDQHRRDFIAAAQKAAGSTL